MFKMWNNERKGKISFGIVFITFFFVTFSIMLADISNQDAFPLYHYIRMCLFVFNNKKDWGLTAKLIVIISGIIYFCIFYFGFMILHCMLGSFLISNIGINIQFKLMNSKLGYNLHKNRLGYMMNLAFWGDLIQIIILIILYSKSMIVHIENRFFESNLNIRIICKIYLKYITLILLIINFCTMIYPLKIQSEKYLKIYKNALILHNSKVAKSSFSMPVNKRINTKWVLLDECEHDYLVKKKRYIEILLVVFYVEKKYDKKQINFLFDKYKIYYNIPHIMYILCSESEISINTNLFDDSYIYTYSKWNLDPSINIIERFEHKLINAKYESVIRLLGRLPSEIVDCYYHLFNAPSCFYNFYRKILNVFTFRQAVNGFFDIIDLAYRLSVFSNVGHFENNDDEIIASMGRLPAMRKLLKKYQCINFKQLLYIDFFDSEMKKILWEKLHIDIVEKVEFESILRIIEHLRNITKAHGFIKDSELKALFELMFGLSLYVFWKLEICSISIHIELEKRQAILKFKNKLIGTFSKYAYVNEDKELYIATNRPGIFINMLTGDMQKV